MAMQKKIADKFDPKRSSVLMAINASEVSFLKYIFKWPPFSSLYIWCAGDQIKKKRLGQS